MPADSKGWTRIISQADYPVGVDHFLRLREAGEYFYAVGYYNRITKSWMLNGESYEGLVVTHFKPIDGPVDSEGDDALCLPADGSRSLDKQVLQADEQIERRYKVTYIDYAHALTPEAAVAIVQSSITNGDVLFHEYCDVEESKELDD